MRTKDQETLDKMLKLVESMLGLSLVWDRLDDKKASRIKYSLNGLNFADHSNYLELMNKTIDVAVKMRDVFKKFL